MRTFICILALAVATCKAGYESGYASDGGSGPSAGDSQGYNYSPSGHGGQVHEYPSFQQSYAQQQPQHASFQPSYAQEQPQHSYPGLNQHYAAAFQGAQDFAGHSGQGMDLSGHGQARGFNLDSHNDVGGQDSYLQAAHDLGQQQNHNEFLLHDGGHDFGSHDSGAQEESTGDGGHGLEQYGQQQANDFSQFHGHSEAIPVGEHVDVEHPVQVPQYKHVTVPVHKPIHINVPKPILVGVPQPYPVKVPVHKPVAVPVETEISIPIEKVVPYPVVKHVPYPVEKHVPIKIEKTVTVHVPQPYPVKIPVYKTIHHHSDH